jgi:hypothetical protein
LRGHSISGSQDCSRILGNAGKKKGTVVLSWEGYAFDIKASNRIISN